MSRRRHKHRQAPAVSQKGSPSIVSTWTGPSGSWKTLSDLLGLQGYAPVLSITEAMRNAVFLLCSDIIAQDHSKATLRMFERTGDDRRREVKPNEHSVAELLAAEPNEDQTWPEFVDMLVRHFCVSQNAFVAKYVTTRGDVRELIPIIPGRVTLYKDMVDGENFYEVSRGSDYERIMLRDFPSRLSSEQMIHIRGRMLDGILGYSTLMSGTEIMSLAQAIQTYQNKLYKGGGSHKPVFSLPKNEEIADEQFKRLREQFKKAHQAAVEGSDPLVLENGATVSMLTMSAKDSEVNLARKEAILDVCRLFRMPPHKVMALESVKYENMDPMERSYVSDTLAPVATRIEAGLKKGLLTREERARYFFEFDRDEMASSDAKMRAEIAKIGVQAGILEIDEARRELGYDPLNGKNGQVRLIPVNVSVVDRENKVIVDGTAGAPTGGDGGMQSTDPLQQPAAGPAKIVHLQR